MTTIATRSNNYFNEINYNNCNYIIRTACSEGLRITIRTTHCVVATIFLAMRISGYVVTTTIAIPNWVCPDSRIAKSTIIPFKMVEFTCDHLEHIILQIIHKVSDLLQQPNIIPVSRLTLARTLQFWQEEAPDERERVRASDYILNTYGTAIGWEPMKVLCSTISNFNMQTPGYYRFIVSIAFAMLNSDFSRELFESSTINLRGLQLRSLPPIFDYKNFQCLSYLHLQNNRLVELPTSIIDLSLTTSVTVDNNEFSEEYMRELTEIRNRTHNRLTGLYSRAQPLFERWNAQNPIRRNLDFNVEGSTYRTTLHRNLDERIPANIGKFHNNDYVITWLNKLAETSDVRRSRAIENFIVTNVVSYLQEANQNPEFEQIFIANINEGAGSCGDRVALSILRLDLAYQLHKADLSNVENLVHLLLNGTWTLNLLELCALEKIRSLSSADEIEVMLGFAISLKNHLSIPTTIETMLFPSLSNVSFRDLQRAKNFVLSSRNNLDLANDFLFEQPKWMEALHHNYPEMMENLQDVEQAERGELEDRYENSFPPAEEYTKLTPHQKNFSKEILSQLYHPTPAGWLSRLPFFS